jgi:endonuclease/exonuclease/phosphatase family metal-dependent hydrolase
VAVETITLGTFNCENLFGRYEFRKGEKPTIDGGFTINKLAFEIYNEDEKGLTAQAIRATRADILGLQEVENLPVLDTFTSTFLNGSAYRHRVLIHGNDPRNIDVAVLSKLPITHLRTWRHRRTSSGSSALFSRDLLEVDVEVPAMDGRPRTLTLFINHLKSMLEGRAQTRARRLEQVHTMLQIVGDRVGPSFEGNFVIAGDMNDYLEDGDGTTTALQELASHPYLVNANEALAPEKRWTHYFNDRDEYRQLDFLWAGKALYERAGRPAPVIVRNGLPRRAERYDGDRFGGVGQDTPKASDHCPVTLTLPTSALL